MARGSGLVVAVFALAALLLACNRQAGETTTTTVTSTTTTHSTTASVPSTTTTVDDTPVVIHLEPFADRMGPEWVELFFPYGTTEDTLGTSPGGDAGTVDWGPEYGTQTPDRSWWFLDAARLRIAHFDQNAGYVDQVLVPESLLVDGLYFQFQMPQALDDGSLAVGGFDRPLLRVVDGAISGVDVAGNIPWLTTDGTYLYGSSFEDSTLLKLDPERPVIEPVEWFSARDGSRYRVTVAEDELLVELPDPGLNQTLQMRFSEDPDVEVRGGVEVDTGVDGTVFIMVYGAPSSDETIGVGGLITMTPGGDVSSEPIVDLFSPSDPGSPAHLGVTPTTSQPWLMVVGEDGVHVFTREAQSS